MNILEITATPPGQAPEWVREKWIGLEIPLNQQQQGLLTIGVLGGHPQNSGGYQVDGKVAIELLEKKSPEAANWWRRNAPFVLSSLLIFKKEVCKVK